MAGADWLIHEIAGVGAAPGVEKFALDRLIRLTPIWNWITRTSPQYRFSTLRLPRRTASGILGPVGEETSIGAARTRKS